MAATALFFVGAFLLILQTTVLHALPDWFGRPDLLFLLVVFVGINLDIYRGSILVLLLGLLMDIFSGILLGLHPIVFLLLFFILQIATRHLAIGEAVHQIPLITISYFLSIALTFAVSSSLAPSSQIAWSWDKEILQVLILAVSTLPFFHFFRWIHLVCTKSKQAQQHPFRQSRTKNRYHTF